MTGPQEAAAGYRKLLDGQEKQNIGEGRGPVRTCRSDPYLTQRARAEKGQPCVCAATHETRLTLWPA